MYKKNKFSDYFFISCYQKKIKIQTKHLQKNLKNCKKTAKIPMIFSEICYFKLTLVSKNELTMYNSINPIIHQKFIILYTKYDFMKFSLKFL